MLLHGNWSILNNRNVINKKLHPSNCYVSLGGISKWIIAPQYCSSFLRKIPSCGALWIKDQTARIVQTDLDLHSMQKGAQLHPER